MRLHVVALGLAALAAFGCANNPKQKKSARSSKGYPKKNPKKRAIEQFTFKDTGVDSNREEGEQLLDEAKLVDAGGKPVGLSEFRGENVVVVFNRGFAGFICPYCTTYTAQIADRYNEFKTANTEVILVYPTKDNQTEKVKEFVAACEEIMKEEGEEGLPFPVYLDPGLSVVKSFNLEGRLSRPSTFVLDTEGVVRYAYVGSSVDDRPTVDRILKEVRELSN